MAVTFNSLRDPVRDKPRRSGRGGCQTMFQRYDTVEYADSYEHKQLLNLFKSAEKLSVVAQREFVALFDFDYPVRRKTSSKRSVAKRPLGGAGELGRGYKAREP